MQIKVSYAKKFQKQLKNAPTNIKKQFLERRVLFFRNQFDKILNNHALIGQYKGFRSINVNGDWRAIFTQDSDSEIIF